MNWEAISAIVELLGLATVVVSVLYLAVQVTNQTREYRLAGIHDVSQNLMHSYAALQDPVMAELWNTGTKDYNSLTEVQKIQIFAFLQVYFRAVEDTYCQATDNRLKTSVWEGIVRFQSRIMATSCAAIFWELRGDSFSLEFQEFITTIEKTEYRVQ
jgi:hypothetical protein